MLQKNKLNNEDSKLLEILKNTKPDKLFSVLADNYPNTSDIPKIAYTELTYEQVNGWFEELESRKDIKIKQTMALFKEFMEQDEDTVLLIEKHKNSIDLILECVASIKGEKEITISAHCYENDDEPYLKDYFTKEDGTFKYNGENQEIKYFLAKAMEFGGHIMVSKILKDYLEFQNSEGEMQEFYKKKVYGLFMGGQGKVAPMTEIIFIEVFENMLDEMFSENHEHVKQAIDKGLYTFGDWAEIPAMKANVANNLDMTNANKYKEKIQEVLFEICSISGTKLITIMYRTDPVNFNVQNFDMNTKGEFLPGGETVFRHFLGEALETAGSIIVRQFLDVKYKTKMENGEIAELPKRVLYGLAIQAGKTQGLNEVRMKEAHMKDFDSNNDAPKEYGVLYGDWNAVKKKVNVSVPKHKLN